MRSRAAQAGPCPSTAAWGVKMLHEAISWRRWRRSTSQQAGVCSARGWANAAFCMLGGAHRCKGLGAGGPAGAPLRAPAHALSG